MLKTTNQKANMRLGSTFCLDKATGLAASIEARKIQGRGAFPHARVTKKDNARIGKTTYLCPKTMEAARIAIPRRNAMTDVLPRTSRKKEVGALYGVFE